MRALRVWRPRPRLFQPHPGAHATPELAWPTAIDVEAARRVMLHHFMVLDPFAARQPVSFAQLVLLYEQQHRAAVVLAAALDRERAR